MTVNLSSYIFNNTHLCNLRMSMRAYTHSNEAITRWLYEHFRIPAVPGLTNGTKLLAVNYTVL